MASIDWYIGWTPRSMTNYARPTGAGVIASGSKFASLESTASKPDGLGFFMNASDAAGGKFSP